jgi:hypothetical protein
MQAAYVRFRQSQAHFKIGVIQSLSVKPGGLFQKLQPFIDFL